MKKTFVKSKPLAAIDIGTNTFRLLIAEVKPRTKDNYNIKEIHSERIITRLGEGISENGLIKKEAGDRSIAVLKKFKDIMSRHHVYKTSAVATSVLREAKNRDDFLKMVKEATGLEIEIISGKEEAKKTLLGILSGTKSIKTALMVDIGGGSTELIFTRGRNPLLIHSLNLGVVHLADKYMKNDPPLKRDLVEMGRYISKKIKSIVKPYLKLKTHPESIGTKLPGLAPKRRDGAGKTVLIGTGGSATTLSGMIQHLTKYEHSKIHNSRITVEEVRNIFSKISTIAAKERIKYHPFEPERLDIIVPGTLILLKLMEAFGFKEIIVSDYGLREGILLDLYRKTKT
jgi:exopolyphosphatase/guanosine-5'-triphosphate,3'-diphosphate pyrophosphatase